MSKFNLTMLVNDVKTVVQKISIESKGQGKRDFPQLGILIGMEIFCRLSVHRLFVRLLNGQEVLTSLV